MFVLNLSGRTLTFDILLLFCIAIATSFSMLFKVLVTETDADPLIVA